MPRALLLGPARQRELTSSYVVTGAGGAIGRAIAERLARHGHVVALDLRQAEWAHAYANVVPLAGDAAKAEVCDRAAAEAVKAAPLRGWVNNAAVFRDATLHETPPGEIVQLIAANLALAVAGCATAVRHMAGGGAIVNVSSHQAQRPVPGALPYATAKAAIEGLTRAAAVDYGPRGIRVNAVALGTIANPRYDELLAERPDTAQEMARLHPIGRVGTPHDVAEVVADLLHAEFVSGAVVPVDGGRAVLGQDPEAQPIS